AERAHHGTERHRRRRFDLAATGLHAVVLGRAPGGLMRNVQLADGQAYSCSDDDTLLRAALRAGFGMPYECNAGSCGTCKVDLLEGQITSLRPDAPGLAERDRAKGRVLACQARPATDCKIKVRLRPGDGPAHRPARSRA